MGGIRVWMGFVVYSMGESEIITERKRPVDKLIVAKWQALASYEGFADNCLSFHELYYSVRNTGP